MDLLQVDCQLVLLLGHDAKKIGFHRFLQRGALLLQVLQDTQIVREILGQGGDGADVPLHVCQRDVVESLLDLPRSRIKARALRFDDVLYVVLFQSVLRVGGLSSSLFSLLVNVFDLRVLIYKSRATKMMAKE